MVRAKDESERFKHALVKRATNEILDCYIDVSEKSLVLLRALKARPCLHALRLFTLAGSGGHDPARSAAAGTARRVRPGAQPACDIGHRYPGQGRCPQCRGAACTPLQRAYMSTQILDSRAHVAAAQAAHKSKGVAQVRTASTPPTGVTGY